MSHQARRNTIINDMKIQMLTPAEVAAQLGVTPRTLQRWRAEGRGPEWRRLSPKVGPRLRGGPIRYPVAGLRAWLRKAA